MNKEEAFSILKFWFDNTQTPTKNEKEIWFFKKHDSEISHKFFPLFQKFTSNIHINLLSIKNNITLRTHKINPNKDENIINSLNQDTIITFKTIIAAIILIDQMPKNMFRNRSEAFFHQNTISNFSLDIIKIIHPKIMSHLAHPKQFFFLILSIIHQENLQNFAIVEKYFIQYFEYYYQNNINTSNIQQKIEIPLQQSITNHKNIIIKFQRYPKRNLALNRPSTNEEKKYIEQSQNRFY